MKETLTENHHLQSVISNEVFEELLTALQTSQVFGEVSVHCLFNPCQVHVAFTNKTVDSYLPDITVATFILQELPSGGSYVPFNFYGLKNDNPLRTEDIRVAKDWLKETDWADLHQNLPDVGVLYPEQMSRLRELLSLEKPGDDEFFVQRVIDKYRHHSGANNQINSDDAKHKYLKDLVIMYVQHTRCNKTQEENVNYHVFKTLNPFGIENKALNVASRSLSLFHSPWLYLNRLAELTNTPFLAKSPIKEKR